MKTRGYYEKRFWLGFSLCLLIGLSIIPVIALIFKSIFGLTSETPSDSELMFYFVITLCIVGNGMAVGMMWVNPMKRWLNEFTEFERQNSRSVSEEKP